MLLKKKEPNTETYKFNEIRYAILQIISIYIFEEKKKKKKTISYTIPIRVQYIDI